MYSIVSLDFFYYYYDDRLDSHHSVEFVIMVLVGMVWLMVGSDVSYCIIIWWD